MMLYYKEYFLFHNCFKFNTIIQIDLIFYINNCVEHETAVMDYQIKKIS